VSSNLIRRYGYGSFMHRFGIIPKDLYLGVPIQLLDLHIHNRILRQYCPSFSIYRCSTSMRVTCFNQGVGVTTISKSSLYFCYASSRTVCYSS
jgi:hypothetical protein